MQGLKSYWNHRHCAEVILNTHMHEDAKGSERKPSYTSCACGYGFALFLSHPNAPTSSIKGYDHQFE
ncbi:unnamed protein product, partial [Sphenostylis stenocarpa]